MKTKMKLVRMNAVTFDESIFIPMKTNTPADEMFSQEGGIFPATNYLIIGDPGTGKTTFGLDVISNITRNDKKKKVLFISAEMNRIDMHGYVSRYPKFGNIDILFLGEYIEHNPKEVIEEALNQGFDIVLADSFLEIQESVAATGKVSRLQAEKWLIDQMVLHNQGKNAAGKNTSFLMIQQVTKGGEFVGSNKLKHNTTGMCELRFTDHYSGERYITFSKNRRGCKHEKLYFSLEEPANIYYDEKRLKRDQEIQSLIKKEKDVISSGNEAFEKLFTENLAKARKEKTVIDHESPIFLNNRKAKNYLSNDNIPF